jgi:hypothetical protein
MVLPMPKPPSKPTPAQKPGYSGDGKEPIKQMRWQMMQEAKRGKIVIPGTGGQKMTEKQVKDIFKHPRFSYGKVKAYLDRGEKIRILRQLRKEDKGKPSRERRVWEQHWNLKSGRDY